MSGEMLRPSDWARLVLASGDCLPRQRARDQQADRAGGEIKRWVLDRLLQLDPEPAAFGAALHQIISESGDPPGPLRAIALDVRDDYHAAATTPELLAWLMARALDRS